MPGFPSKHRNALNQNISTSSDRQQIRIVPYTPPRLSTDDSAPSCPVSRAACSPLNKPSAGHVAQNDAHATYSPNFRVEPGRKTPPNADFKYKDEVRSDAATELANVTTLNSNPIEPAPPLATVSPSRSYRRIKRIISVNADKTFSLSSQACPSSSARNPTPWVQRSSTDQSTSQRITASESPGDRQSTSAITTLQGLSQSSSEDCTSLAISENQAQDSSSPWNYQLTGGLRKVPESAQKTNHLWGDNAVPANSRSGDFSPVGPSRAGDLTSKQSFHSYQSTSTLSQKNYTILAHDSPCPKPKNPVAISDKVGSEQTLASSQPANLEATDESSEQSSNDQSPPRNSESNRNYIVHQASLSWPAGAPPISPLQTEYSRESLMVAPLRPGRRHISHQTSLSNQISENSLRTDSIVSVSSTSMDDYTSSTIRQIPSGVARQLSTGGVIPGNSEVIEPPQPTYFKDWKMGATGSSLRLIGDQDEHGDGLAELGVLRRHPSRTRLQSYLSNFSSDRNLHTAGSSHSYSYSFSRSYIPTWARLYYGSGEHRLLPTRQSSESLYSMFNGYAQPHSPRIARSASFGISNVANNTHHQRHPSAPVGSRSSIISKVSDKGILISDRQLSTIRRIRKQTSSIWSPHLVRDKRAQLYSFWRPPSVEVVTRENKVLRDRIQMSLFVLGFVFPIAWITASFLPLPTRIGTVMEEKILSTSHLDLEQGTNVHNKVEVRASCHDREKWWRNLNRFMSIIGVFLVGAVLALTITGTQQQWKS